MNDVRFEVHNLLINARAQSERQRNSFVPGARKTPGTNHLCTIEFLRHSNVRCDNQDANGDGSTNNAIRRGL